MGRSEEILLEFQLHVDQYSQVIYWLRECYLFVLSEVMFEFFVGSRNRDGTSFQSVHC